MSPLTDIRAVTLIVTAGCNLRCRYCYQDWKHAASMPWPVLQAAIDLASRSRHRRVSVGFMGGEPLIEARLVRRAIRYANTRRAPARWRFSLTTNGLLLTPRLVEFVVRHEVGITLSFDGVPAAQQLRAPGSFEALDRLLDRLAGRHPAYFRRRLSVAVTVTPRSVPLLERSVRYLLSKGVREIQG